MARIVLSVFLLLSTFSYTAYSQLAIADVPEKVDSLAVRFNLINTLPDSVVEKRTTLFYSTPEIDEIDLILVEKYVKGIQIASVGQETRNGPWGDRKPYTKVRLTDRMGNVINEFSTNKFGSYYLDLEETPLEDGFYHLSIDYGKKHTANGTKPKQRMKLEVYVDTTGSTGFGRYRF